MAMEEECPGQRGQLTQGREWAGRTEDREATEREQVTSQVWLCRPLCGPRVSLSDMRSPQGFEWRSDTV